MGIHDRDYYRDGGGVFEAWGRQGVTVWLIVVTAATFVAQLLTGDGLGRTGRLTDAAVYDPALILQGEVWRLLTCVFLHGGLFHLFFNMLVLYWAGQRLEDRYGGREFLAFYLLAGAFASAAMLLAQATGFDRPAQALGASGAVTAVLVLFACHYPRQQILVMFVIPMPVWLAVALYVGLDAVGAFGGGAERDGVAYTAHLGGALFGLLYYKAGIRIAGYGLDRPVLRRERAAAPPPRLRVVPADPEDLPDRPAPVRPGEPGFDARVDAVLEKVSQSGQESLTPEEREVLFRAGEVYKRRRK